MLKTIRENVYLGFFNQSISQYARRNWKERKVCPYSNFWFHFHVDNRAYFAQIRESFVDLVDTLPTCIHKI